MYEVLHFDINISELIPNLIIFYEFNIRQFYAYVMYLSKVCLKSALYI